MGENIPKIIEVKISEVKTNPNNPRIIKDDKFKQLVKSVQEFPEMLKLRPIVVNDDMVILGGNMRLKACKEAGYKTIYITKASGLTEEKQNEFIVKDNVGFGEWNWEELANNWDAEQLTDWGLDIPIFKEVEELEDISDKIKSEFRIEVVCKDEIEQELKYNKLIEMGYECRLLTL